MQNQRVTWKGRAAVALLWWLLGAVPVSAQIVGLGGFGDSLTDEYFEDGYGYAKSWYQQIHDYRGGAGGPLGSWGEPRRNGYRNNWARFGAGTQDLKNNVQNNLAALTAQVTSGQITHAAVFIGTNDYGPWNSNVYGNLYNNTWSPSQITAYQDQVVDNIRQTVLNLKATGVPLVLSSFQDYGTTPRRQDFGYPDPVKRQRVTDAISGVNDALAALAAQQGLPFVDMFHFGEAVFGTNASLNATLSVGGQTISLQGKGTAATNGFVSDGAHHHSVLQGLMANLFLDAFQRGYNSGTAPFTQQEIVTNAGLVYGGDTLPLSLASFVTINVIPEPRPAGLLFPAALAAALTLRQGFRARRRPLPISAASPRSLR